MRVLVTGAAGFIGSWVCERLLERGDEVVALDNFDAFYARDVKERNLLGLRRAPACRFVEGDLLDVTLLGRLLDGVDAVVHLAALAGVRPSLAAPARYMRVNVEGTVGLLEACRQRAVNRLVVASSSSVYGVRAAVPFREDDPCDTPASPYAASKRATELVCRTHHDLYGLGISCLRYFTVYGPRQRPEMAIYQFVRLALAGQPIALFGDGSSSRDYTFVDDIVAGTLAALDRQDGRFAIYNLGGEHPVSLSELCAAIGQAIGRPLRLEHRPDQAGDVPRTAADTERARRDLGYAPRVSLDQGLASFVAWYRSPGPLGDSALF